MTTPKRKVSAKPSKTKAKATPKPAQSTPKMTVAERRTAFIEAYLQNGGNATQAALAAGFSKKSAYSTGGKLVRHPQVRALIDARQEELRKKHELTTDSVLNNLRQTLQFDPRKLYNADGSLKGIHEIDDDTAMALTGIESLEEFAGVGKNRTHVGTTKKLKWLDKNVARDQANKILGHYKKDNEQPGAPVAEAITTGFDALRAKFKEALAKKAGSQ